jgi:demethylmenaquinone methyltransferase/2-methoxy-6-polyprenyl-1,4-benzoquinol methylase
VSEEQAGLPKTADFGFGDVRADAKQVLVDRVFDRVARRYDLMNDLMSGGLHRLWKRMLVDWLAPPRISPFLHLDVAGGTGDVAFRILRAATGARSVVCDINLKMLRVGEERATRRGLGARVALAVGNAEALPFRSRSFDAYTIAFGIRNVTRREAALAEAHRVLRPGGRFLCLEFAEVVVPLLDRIYEAYSFKVIPGLGRLVAGDSEPYRYLVESIRRFPRQSGFADMVRDAGFARVQWRDLSGGIAAIHSGWRL